MQIPIVNGIYTDDTPEYRTSYPKNMMPTPKVNGISSGYLKPADGLVEFTEGTGYDRGGINWNGVMYRAIGKMLCKIDANGEITELGNIGGTNEQVTFSYSFDRLAVASVGFLYYYDGISLTRVTDSDIGTVLDVEWVDGYFMTTDGEYLIVTELTDPTQVDPLKYGSSEASPDPIKALLKLRNEIYALNRYSIEVFDNIGGSAFPFGRIESAQIDKGTVGTHASAVFLETIAFLGSGRNEAISIWLGNNATTRKISSREIDQLLSEYTEEQLEFTLLETRVENSNQFLYVHLPDKTLVYDASASEALQTPAWFILSSSLSGFGQYRAKNFVYCYNKWLFGDPTTYKIGYLDKTISSHFGDKIEWEFGTTIIYNEARGAIIHQLELIGLTGRVALGAEPVVSTAYSVDGITFTDYRSINAGTQGDRTKRLVWLQQGHMIDKRIQKFRGTSDLHMSVARIEAQIEPLMN